MERLIPSAKGEGLGICWARLNDKRMKAMDLF